MRTPQRSFAWILLCVLITGCTTITNMSPNPAATNQQVLVDMTGVIGPTFLEPGAKLEFDGTTMPVNPDSSSQVGFVVPGSAAPGDHTVTVTDQIGLIEAILIFPLFKDRTDSATLTVGTSRDIGVAHFEITQGLQRDANDIPLVTGKPAVIRVFPIVADVGSDIANVTAELHALRGGVELPGSPIAPDNGPITVSTVKDRAEPDDSLNFTLDPDWYAQNTDFWVSVSHAGSDPDLSNNRFPTGTGNFNATYNNRDGLAIRYVSVEYDNTNWTGATTPRAHIADQATCDWMRAIYPADPSEITYDPWVPDTMTFTQTTGTSLDAAVLITELNVMFNASTNPGDRLYGWTPEGSISFNGLSDPLWAGGQNNVACGNDTEGATPPLTSRYRRTFAHEMGHNTNATGLFHTSRRLESDEFGYDTLNVDPFNRIVMRTYPATDPNPTLDLFDFMRGGELEPHAWITPPYYDVLYNWMAPGFTPDSSLMADTSTPMAGDIISADNFITVRGKVTRNGGGNFYPFYEIPASSVSRQSAAAAPTSGSHEVRFLTENGDVVRSIKWTPDFRADDSQEPLKARPFTWIVPRDAEVRSVELLIEGNQVSRLEVAASQPRVSALALASDSPSLNAKAIGEGNVLNVSWAAEADESEVNKSLDSDAEVGLVHQVYYSNNDGESWFLVATGLTDPAADVQLGKLPGGDACLIRVVSSDGFNASSVNSKQFSVTDKPPISTIISPRNTMTRAQGGGVLLIGRGYDLEDGPLKGQQLAWESNVQGELGSGEKLVVRNLRVGEHSIILRSHDSSGKTTVSEAVLVSIEAR